MLEIKECKGCGEINSIDIKTGLCESCYRLETLEELSNRDKEDEDV